jgi:hypothetical protein
LINCLDRQLAGEWPRTRSTSPLFERDECQAAAFDDLFVTAIEFIGNYEMLVGLDGVQILFSPSERKFTVVRSYQGHGGCVNAIRCDRGRSRFLSAGSDHVILVQPLNLSSNFV